MTLLSVRIVLLRLARAKAMIGSGRRMTTF
jgi:hypothetical protein